MKAPYVGQRVGYPTDRGDQPGQGVVVFVSVMPQENINGVPYVWTHVKYADGFVRVWPSHRLQ